MTTDLTVLVSSALPLLRRDDYDSVIIRFNEFLNGRTVDPDNVRDFFKEESKTYKARTIQVHKCAIKAAILAAYPTYDLRERAYMDQVFKAIKVPKPDGKVQEKELFTQEEIRAIVSHAPEHIGLFIRSCYDTGSRVSECLGMRLDKCVEDSEAVRCPIMGKGKKERTLMMTKPLFHQVREYFGGSVWLFENTGRGKHYSRQHLWYTIVKHGRAATGRHIHPHSLRHSRITHMLEAGLPLDAVSRFAGHVDTKTTLAFYAHVTLKAAQIIAGTL